MRGLIFRAHRDTKELHSLKKQHATNWRATPQKLPSQASKQALNIYPIILCHFRIVINYQRGIEHTRLGLKLQTLTIRL